jgi:serine/threonine protein kinase
MLDRIEILHEKNILHRDIKPENIVLSNVLLLIFRGSVSFATLDGQFIVKKDGQHIVVLLITFARIFLRESPTITLSTSGLLECWHMR